jgi:glutamate N-acetyltransferase/amino-acid N-acetyltransferase
MIEPDMATMLSFITTDADVDADSLQECLAEAVNASFNRISIDGDQSCNDTVLLMANGASGASRLDRTHSSWGIFTDAVKKLALELAQMIVKDGEGATKFVTVTVKGAASVEDAEKAARCISNSLLVKTSWYGCDPNWGRVIDAAGYSGADLQEELVDIWYDELCSVKQGCVAEGTDLADLEAVLRKDDFTLTVDLNLGGSESTVYTCDCSEEYVRINSEYTT